MADKRRAGTKGIPAVNETLPKDVESILNIMHSMGADTDSPRVMSQLLEFVQRFSSEVLIKARVSPCLAVFFAAVFSRLFRCRCADAVAFAAPFRGRSCGEYCSL
jgi:hypothetical protein